MQLTQHVCHLLPHEEDGERAYRARENTRPLRVDPAQCSHLHERGNTHDDHQRHQWSEEDVEEHIAASEVQLVLLRPSGQME
ncbi:MAG TPA: hypothetical protein VEZ12_11160 [Herpetosiphonaceae bacterium]|nr:hypothetical protein [Herpetosiphonaceae bacterium]